MRAIGFEQDWRYWEGSGSSRGRRQDAAAALPAALRDAGFEPDSGLMNLVTAVAHADRGSDYSLQLTYAAAAAVIRWHTEPGSGRRSPDARAVIVERHAPAGRAPRFNSVGHLIGHLGYEPGDKPSSPPKAA
jgi:hypothetical protein